MKKQTICAVLSMIIGMAMLTGCNSKPTADLVVVITSSAGCTMLSSSSTASAIYSPMPLSAPNEVPCAFIHPFST